MGAVSVGQNAYEEAPSGALPPTRRREFILEAALDALPTAGSTASRLGEVADRAGISKALITSPSILRRISRRGLQASPISSSVPLPHLDRRRRVALRTV